jgi:hypothetical protein
MMAKVRRAAIWALSTASALSKAGALSGGSAGALGVVVNGFSAAGEGWVVMAQGKQKATTGRWRGLVYQRGAENRGNTGNG